MIVHLNGQLLSRSEARIEPFDRGFIFGEGVYEGLRSITWPSSSTGARVIGIEHHIRRMQRGLDAAQIPFDARQLDRLSLDLLAANGMTEAFVYWQVTGGTPGEGDPVRSRFPGKNTKPTVFGYCAQHPPLETLKAPVSKKVACCRDVRWELGWLKSISLMGNTFAAKLVGSKNADEAIFIRGGDPETFSGGVVAEGLATNILLAFAKPGGGVELVTPALQSAPMLAGVTRDILLHLEPGIIQRTVAFEELSQAAEIMLIGTTTYVSAVTHVDGRAIAGGIPGPHCRRLHTLLIDSILAGKDMSPPAR